MDKAIDQLHAETGAKRDQARDMVARSADELRKKFESGDGRGTE